MSGKQDTASRRGADEIVEEIVDHLRPWKTQSVAAITAAVSLRCSSSSLRCRRSFLTGRGIGRMPRSSTVRSARSRGYWHSSGRAGVVFV